MKLDSLEIYRYLCYREYLADYVKGKEATVRGFSQRQFARRAGISTGNYLAKVLRRERNLGPRQAEKFIRAMGLLRCEADYFRALVALEQAPTTAAKMEHLERVEAIRRRKLPLELKRDDEFYRHWYTAVIYELASCRDFDPDPAAISRAFKGAITPGEAKQTLEFLLEQGYLDETPEGLKQRVGISVGSSQFSTNLFLRASHRKMSEAAQDAIDLPLDERSFQGVYLALSRSQMPQVKRKLLEFAEELIREFGSSRAREDADRVIRFNLQAFPVAVTRRKGRSRS